MGGIALCWLCSGCAVLGLWALLFRVPAGAHLVLYEGVSARAPLLLLWLVLLPLQVAGAGSEQTQQAGSWAANQPVASAMVAALLQSLGALRDMSEQFTNFSITHVLGLGGGLGLGLPPTHGPDLAHHALTCPALQAAAHCPAAHSPPLTVHAYHPSMSPANCRNRRAVLVLESSCQAPRGPHDDDAPERWRGAGEARMAVPRGQSSPGAVVEPDVCCACSHHHCRARS